MASQNLTSGRPDPRITGLLGKAAAGNAGRYIANALPINFNLASVGGAPYFRGYVRSLPLNQVYGDARAVGTDLLKRGPGQNYLNLTRERTFSETLFECAERSAKVLVDQIEIDRTDDDEIAALNMRDSRAMQLYSTLMDAFEFDVAANVFSTSLFQNAAVGALTGGVQIAWNEAGSSPARDGVAVKNLIRAQSGVRPSFACVSNDVVEALRYHPETLGVVLRGDATQGIAGAAVPAALLQDDEVLNIWARLWGLRDGLFKFDAMYNSANPAATGTLAEMASGVIAFHCADGLRVPPTQVVDNVEVFGGAQSILVLRESEMRGFENETIDPHGLQLAAKHSYDIIAPNALAAYVLTDVLG